MRSIIIVSVLCMLGVFCFGERLNLDSKEGHFAFLGGIAIASVDDMNDMDGFDMGMNMILLGAGYAITEELDIQIMLPYIMWEARGDLKDMLDAMGEDTSESDMADLEVQAIYELEINRDELFASFMFGASLPTADEDEFGNGVVRLNAGAGISYEGDPLVAALDLSFDFGEEPEDTNYDKNTTMNLEARFGLRTTPASAAVLVFTREDSHDEDEDPNTMAGLGYMVRSRDELQFQIGYLMGMNDDSMDSMIQLMLIYQFM